MSSVCQSSVDLADPPAQIHLSCYKSDAQLVRSLAAVAAACSRTTVNNINQRRSIPNAAPVVDSHYCRQKFLRSYTFSKKETVPQKTAKCFVRLKASAGDLPCICRQSTLSRDNSFRFSLLSLREPADCKTKKGLKSRKVRGRLAFLRILQCLISCVSSFDVADGDAVVHAF